MLDVRRMRVLREVAARGSFSAAAEALNFTQSAVSQQVAALERESRTKLVERDPRGIRLTEAGEALVAHADAIIARLDDAEQELAAIAGLRGGRLRLASFQSAGATLVPRALGEFHSRYPNVELSVATAENEDEQTQAFVAAGLGVALWPQLALAAVHPGVVVKPLSKTRLERRVYSATLRDSYCSAAAEAMIATLCEVAREFAPTGRLRAA